MKERWDLLICEITLSSESALQSFLSLITLHTEYAWIRTEDPQNSRSPAYSTVSIQYSTVITHCSFSLAGAAFSAVRIIRSSQLANLDLGIFLLCADPVCTKICCSDPKG